jgi:hypothetical protein
MIIEVSRRGDGKLYPAQPLTHAERNRARWLAHNLVHRDGLTIRQAQRTMIESYGVRRSVGIIARDLRDYECPACSPEPGPPLTDAELRQTTRHASAGWAGPQPW